MATDQSSLTSLPLAGTPQESHCQSLAEKCRPKKLAELYARTVCAPPSYRTAQAVATHVSIRRGLCCNLRLRNRKDEASASSESQGKNTRLNRVCKIVDKLNGLLYL